MTALEPAATWEGHDAALEHLDRAECFRLLASATVGRLAVPVPDEPPLVVPVNYALDGEAIVIRTGPGAKLDALSCGMASFQVDAIDPFRRTGWSVLVRGFAFPASAGPPDLEPWGSGSKDHWVRVFPGAVTGRRLRPVDLHLDGRGYL